MLRVLVSLTASSALYGFTLGAGHSWLYATRNILKFPLLILTTASVCALAYYVLARFLAPKLSFRDVQRLVILLFRDTSVLLAGLSPVSLFLALTMEPPTSMEELGGYPSFQGLNVVLIAVCGALALVRQAKVLLHDYGLGRQVGAAIIVGWLALSLFTGGQGAWYMRPFFGVALGGPTPPLFLGATPDFRGARSFYEAVYNLVVPPARGQ